MKACAGHASAARTRWALRDGPTKRQRKRSIAPAALPARDGSAATTVEPTGNYGTRCPWASCSTRTVLVLPIPTPTTSVILPESGRVDTTRLPGMVRRELDTTDVASAENVGGV